MSDTATDTSTQDGKATSGDTSAAGDEFKPITSQAELDARIGDRLARERNKFADYDDLRTKAARFDELEEANKTEVQKAADRAAAAEQTAEQAKAEALRFKIAAKFAVSEEDADLFLTGADEETLTKQAERLTAREADRKKVGNVSPREGVVTTPAESDERATARALFKRGD